MSHLHFSTKHLNESQVKRNWYVVDASDKVLGRVSSRIASILMGKNKPYFSKHVDCGDYVVVINADKIKLTGNKMNDKQYIHHSGYPGGQKSRQASSMLERKPEFLMEAAVKGMLPKNRLGRKVFKKLFVYVSDTHPHTAQKPVQLSI